MRIDTENISDLNAADDIVPLRPEAYHYTVSYELSGVELGYISTICINNTV